MRIACAGGLLLLLASLAHAGGLLAASIGVHEPRALLGVAALATALYAGVIRWILVATGTPLRAVAPWIAATALPALALGAALGPLGALDLSRFAVLLDPVYVGDGFSRLAVRLASLWLFAGAGWALLWLGAAAAFVRAWSRGARAPSIGAILLVGFAVLAPLNAWRTLVSMPMGDEPHYLVVVESMRRDGDVDLRDNYDDDSTRGLYPFGLQGAGGLSHVRERDGRWISVRGLGLPALLLPAWSGARRYGVAAILALCAALLGAALVAAARRLALPEVTARTAWGVGMFLSPLYAFAGFAYPDPVAATAVFGVFAWGVLDAPRTPRAAARVDVASGLVLGLLPFLHFRFALLSATLLVLGSWRGAWRAPARRRTVWLAASGALVAYAVLHLGLYGAGNPYADTGTGGYTLSDLYSHPPIRGAVELLMSPAAGVLPRFPALWFAVFGLVLWWRNDRPLATWVLLVSLPWFLYFCPMRYWHGGASAPARYLLPIVPWLVLAAAHGIVRARADRAGRWLAGATLGAGALLAALASAAPSLWYSWRAADLVQALAPDGVGRAIASALESPSLSRPAQRAALALLLLVAVASVAAASRARFSTPQEAGSGAVS
jgi:hypothetical protein